jgi:hypothetical protein
VVPAIKGTIALLTSALEQAGPQLEAIVVTSSVAALTNLKVAEGHVFTEADKNSWAVDAAKNADAIPEALRGVAMYSASKTAADHAVWEFRDNYKVDAPMSCDFSGYSPLTLSPQPHFSLTTIHPSIVIGPPVLVPSSPSKLNETLKPLYSILAGLSPTIPPKFGSGAIVDVRCLSASPLGIRAP